MEDRINAHIIAQRPYVTLVSSISASLPSFTSEDPPSISITLLLHNTPGPITIRFGSEPLPEMFVDLVYPDGAVRRYPGHENTNIGGFRRTQLSRPTSCRFVTLWPQKPHTISASFRPNDSSPGDPSVPYKEYEATNVSTVTIKGLELLRSASMEEVGAYFKQNMPQRGPCGMDKCVIGREYVLRIKDGLRLNWWQYGELEELLCEADAIQRINERQSVVPQDGNLEVLTYDEHREIRFTPMA